MIYHITNRRAWFSAEMNGEYRPPSLITEGFIHFSERDQLLRVAEHHYRGVTDLLLLEVDEEKLDAELRYESAIDLGEKFPHLYGALNSDAVTRTFDFSADSAGNFQLPPNL